jgi:AcrR family transcriptional regulator
MRKKKATIQRRRLAPLAGASRPLTKSHQKEAAPSATVERILEGARQVLIRDGHVLFTSRRVTESVGMRVGNLTYHFPSKRELLLAVITRLLAFYTERFDAIFATADVSATEGIARLVRWLLEDAIDAETVAVFRELWVLGLRDPQIGEAVDDFYDAAIERVVKLFLRSRPEADVDAVRELVQLLGLVSEGTLVFYGTRAKRAVSYERIIEIVSGLANVLVPDERLTPKG